MTSWHKKTSGRVVIGVAVVAVLAWSGAWFYGARHVKKVIQEVLSDDQLAGQIEIRQDLHMGGYPFRLKAHADQAEIILGGADGPKVTVGPYALWANAWSPNTLHFSFADVVAPEEAFRIKSAEGYVTWDFWNPGRTREKMLDGTSSIEIHGLSAKDTVDVAKISASRKESRSSGRGEEKHTLDVTGVSIPSRTGGVPFVVDHIDFKALLDWDANGAKGLPVSFTEGQNIPALGAASSCFPPAFSENLTYSIIDDIEKRKTALDADLKIKVQDFSLDAHAHLDLKNRQPNVAVKLSLKNLGAFLKAVEATEPEGSAQLHQSRQTADMVLAPMGIKNGEDYTADLALQDGAFSVNGKTITSGFKINWEELFKSEGCNISVAQAMQLLDLARAELFGGDPARAMTIYNVLAARDIWVADYYIGYMHYQGVGTSKDEAAAEAWVKKAAAHGLSFKDITPAPEMEKYVEWAKKIAPPAVDVSQGVPHAAVTAVGGEPVSAPAVQEVGSVEDAGSVFAHRELPENYAPKA